MHILVTGAAGFIGSHVAHRYASQGHEVLGIDNFDNSYHRSYKESNAVHAGNVLYTDLRTPGLANLVRDFAPSLVVHLAAKSSVVPSMTNPLAYVHNNVCGTVNLLEACLTVDHPTIVFASSYTVYGSMVGHPYVESDATLHSSLSPYGVTKLACESLLSTYANLHDLRIACLRFSSIYGPRQRPDTVAHKFTKSLLDGTPITIYGDGSSTRDYLYIDDAVDAIQTVPIEAGFHVYNAGTGVETSISTLANTLASIVGVPCSPQYVPALSCESSRMCMDASKLAASGWHPRVSLDDGLTRTVEWLKGSSV